MKKMLFRLMLAIMQVIVMSATLYSMAPKPRNPLEGYSLFTIENQTGSELVELFVRETGKETWPEYSMTSSIVYSNGKTTRVNHPIPNGQYKETYIPPDFTGSIDIKATDSSGRSFHKENVDPATIDQVAITEADYFEATLNIVGIWKGTRKQGHTVGGTSQYWETDKKQTVEFTLYGDFIMSEENSTIYGYYEVEKENDARYKVTIGDKNDNGDWVGSASIFYDNGRTLELGGVSYTK